MSSLYPNPTAKNGVYDNLVNEVRQAFEGSNLVKVDCRGLNPSDYKKIGAKLMVCKETSFCLIPIALVLNGYMHVSRKWYCHIML